MRRIVSLITLTFVSLMVLAQSQQGYVKTKGRLANNGTIIAGTRLSGATVSVKGGNAVLSGNNGSFSLSVPNNNYFLQNVQKQGYVLTDPDVLSKQYALSKDPLVLVLEDKNQQAADRRAIERKISSSLYAQLQKRNDELEALKEQHKITEEKYRELLQKLNSDQDDNEKLISEMADRYSKMDFDEVDEFNRRISQLILDGKLSEADSLLNTKGDIRSRTSQLRQHQEANAQEEQDIKKKQKKLEESKLLAQKELEDLAQDCYSKFEIFKMQHENDSAASYIELRADLDTSNILWQLDAGLFIKDYLVNYKKAEDIYMKAEKFLSSQNYDNNNYAVSLFINFSSLFFTIGQYQKSIDYSRKALSLINNDMPNHQKYYSFICANMGNSYEYLDQLDSAQDFLKKSLQTSIEVYGEYHKETAICYSNLGVFYQRINQDSLALNCYIKAMEIGQRDTIACYEEMDYFYNNLAVAYSKQQDYDLAEMYSQKALESRKSLYGANHPRLAVLYHNCGSRKLRQKKYEEALDYFVKAIGIWENTFGEEHHLIDGYGSTGQVYELMGDVRQALAYYEKGADVGLKYYGRDNSEAWVLLPSICIALESIIKTDPNDSIVAKYKRFISETAVIAIIPGGVDTPAAKLGMRGIYYVLKYGQWDIGKETSFFDEFFRLQGKLRQVVFLKEGNIETHSFEKSIGGNFMLRYVTPEEKDAIIEIYKNSEQ